VPGSLFGFVQFEFPFSIGPADGRYVVRGPGGLASHVLVIGTLGAPERRTVLGRRAKRPKDAKPLPEPEPVPTTRVTLVDAEPFPDSAAADRWRAGLDADAEADRAIVVLNEVVHAHRAAAADPYVREVSREQALVSRVGVGEGEQVANGHWTKAVTLPAAKERAAERRASVLRPQERLAAILTGRDVALAAEHLTMRARLDLDAGRTREAALQLRIALEVALAELVPWADRGDLSRRLEALRAERGTVGDAANEAVQGGLEEATAKEVERVLRMVEAALRARTQFEMTAPH
jgi:hypothetical protein